MKQNLVSELLSENASSNLVSNFSHQIFLVKMVRLLGVIFQDFHQIFFIKKILTFPPPKKKKKKKK
jgi:hypothetical protein